MVNHFFHSMRNEKQLIWIYPPNNWISNFKRTFVYGSSDPRAKLFISTEAGLAPAMQKIKIFPNGNFAKVIKLPNKTNIIKMVQILNRKKKTITRRLLVRNVGARFIASYNKLKRSKTKKKNPPTPHSPLPPFVVVIDPGHGGKEHGTHSPKNIPEKHFNLQIAKMLVKTLRATSLRRGKIYLTRNTDKYVSLKGRVNFAKKKKADLLISIHHNALPDNENPLNHRGVGIYYTHDFVKPFAKKLLESISKSVGAGHGMPLLKKYGTFKRNFALTRPDFCYAVLIECGFLIHPEEAEIITKRKTQERIVKGIVKAVCSL